MKLSRLTLTMGSLVLLSACSLAPVHETPDMSVADRLSSAINETTPAREIAWQDFYQNPQLKTLIAKALSNNHDLRTAALRVEQVRAQYRIREADRFPPLDGNAAISRQRSPAAMSFVNNSQVVDQYSVGVGIASWEIDIFGRIRNLSEQALQEFFASQSARDSVQLSLIAEVADTFYSWHSDIAQLKLAENTRDARAESYQLIQQRFDNGLASELELRQAETLLHSARVDVARFQQQLNQRFTALQLLVAETLDSSEWQADESLLDFAELPADLDSETLLQRPDVIEAEYRLKAANANIGAVRAEFFPRISLTSSLGLLGTSPANMLNTSARSWQISPQLTVPIIDWGRNQAQLDVAELEREILIVQYQQVLEQAFKEVHDELQAQQTLDDQLHALQDLTLASKRGLELAELRYEQGLDSYLEVLDAQRTVLDAQQAEISVKLARTRNQLTLYKAMGGGLMAR